MYESSNGVALLREPPLLRRILSCINLAAQCSTGKDTKTTLCMLCHLCLNVCSAIKSLSMCNAASELHPVWYSFCVISTSECSRHIGQYCAVSCVDCINLWRQHRNCVTQDTIGSWRFRWKEAFVDLRYETASLYASTVQLCGTVFLPDYVVEEW